MRAGCRMMGWHGVVRHHAMPASSGLIAVERAAVAAFAAVRQARLTDTAIGSPQSPGATAADAHRLLPAPPCVDPVLHHIQTLIHIAQASSTPPGAICVTRAELACTRWLV